MRRSATLGNYMTRPRWPMAIMKSSTVIRLSLTECYPVLYIMAIIKPWLKIRPPVVMQLSAVYRTSSPNGLSAKKTSRFFDWTLRYLTQLASISRTSCRTWRGFWTHTLRLSGMITLMNIMRRNQWSVQVLFEYTYRMRRNTRDV